MKGRILFLIAAGGLLATSLPQAGQALPIATLGSVQASGSNDVTLVAQDGKRERNAQQNRNRGNQNVHVNQNARVNKNVNVNRNIHVDKNVRVNRNVRVNKTVIVRRPYRAWGYRPYYGTIVAGVALGTVIGVSAAYAVPVAPGPNLCWYWADPAGYRGYWDYCTVPY